MDALGINIFSILVYTILFGIIFIVLDKLLLPPLRKSIEARKHLIASNLLKSQELIDQRNSFTEEMRANEKEILQNSKLRAEEIIANSESEAIQLLKQAKAKSEEMLLDIKSALTIKESKLNATFIEKVRTASMNVFKAYYGEDEKLDQVKLAKALETIK